MNRLRSSSLSSCRGHRRDLGLDLGLLALVVVVAGEFVERFDVADPLGQRIEGVEVVFQVGVLRVELARVVLIVPQRRVGHLGFEHREPLPVLGDRQIARRLVEAALDVGNVGGEVAHQDDPGGPAFSSRRGSS